MWRIGNQYIQFVSLESTFEDHFDKISFFMVGVKHLSYYKSYRNILKYYKILLKSAHYFRTVPIRQMADVNGQTKDTNIADLPRIREIVERPQGYTKANLNMFYAYKIAYVNCFPPSLYSRAVILNLFAVANPFNFFFMNCTR